MVQVFSSEHNEEGLVPNSQNLDSLLFFHSLVNNNPNPTLVLDPHRLITFRNHAAEALFQTKLGVGERCNLSLTTDRVHNLKHAHHSGIISFLEYRVTPFSVEQSKLLLLSFYDISVHQHEYHALKQRLLEDELSGLYNRQGFLQLSEGRLAQAKRSDQEAHLLLIGINNLKSINEAHGFIKGDEIIHQTGLLLRDCFRESDLLGRVSGGTFGVLTIHEHATTPKDLIKRLRDILKEHNENHATSLSLSVRYTTFLQEEHRSTEDLIHQAEEELKQAIQS